MAVLGILVLSLRARHAVPVRRADDRRAGRRRAQEPQVGARAARDRRGAAPARRHRRHGPDPRSFDRRLPRLDPSRSAPAAPTSGCACPASKPYQAKVVWAKGQYARLRLRAAAPSGRARDDRQEGRRALKRGWSGPIRSDSDSSTSCVKLPESRGGDANGIGLSLLFAARRRGAAPRPLRDHPGRGANATRSSPTCSRTKAAKQRQRRRSCQLVRG